MGVTPPSKRRADSRALSVQFKKLEVGPEQGVLAVGFAPFLAPFLVVAVGVGLVVADWLVRQLLLSSSRSFDLDEDALSCVGPSLIGSQSCRVGVADKVSGWVAVEMSSKAICDLRR